jgi:hypothetical protein
MSEVERGVLSARAAIQAYINSHLMLCGVPNSWSCELPLPPETHGLSFRNGFSWLRDAAESLWLIEIRVEACDVSHRWVYIPAVDNMSWDHMLDVSRARVVEEMDYESGNSGCVERGDGNLPDAWSSILTFSG